MLRPCVPVEEFEKFGFRRCKGYPKDFKCYYLCVAHGQKMIFVSSYIYMVNHWDNTDMRIHKHPNCKYRDMRTVDDITFELTKAGMLEQYIG